MRGRRIALTGAIPGVSRSDFRDRLTGLGARYATRLDEYTDLLVVGDNPLQSKLDQARTLEVEALTWSDFEQQLHTPVDEEKVPLAVPRIAVLPSLEVTPEGARILDLVLQVRSPGPMTPSPKAFPDYTLDAPTLDLLRSIGRAVALGHPCLIEGDTATSKTSAIRYLAALVGAGVVRVNLNGQTDTSELVGRYVPAEGGGWRFSEGLVPRAMREGWWLVLDEVNLASPAILERLNPVLERQPELVLTEGPNTRFGPGGDVPVHEDFRVLATMNPAEYVGRSVLSEAWRDRFPVHVVARQPGELEFRQLLEHAVFGNQPEVEARGRRWGPAALETRGRPGLQHIPDIGVQMAQLAALFAALVEMSAPGTSGSAPLGVGRRERYVFSRRGLLAALDGVEGLRLVDETGEPCDSSSAPSLLFADAVEAATLAKMRDPEDRERVRVLLESLGWVFS